MKLEKAEENFIRALYDYMQAILKNNVGEIFTYSCLLRPLSNGEMEISGQRLVLGNDREIKFVCHKCDELLESNSNKTRKSAN